VFGYFHIMELVGKAKEWKYSSILYVIVNVLIYSILKMVKD